MADPWHFVRASGARQIRSKHGRRAWLYQSQNQPDATGYSNAQHRLRAIVSPSARRCTISKEERSRASEVTTYRESIKSNPHVIAANKLLSLLGRK